MPDRPKAQLLYQDYADAHAYGVPYDGGAFWCMAKLAGMDYEDFLAEGEETLDQWWAAFGAASTLPPEGVKDSVPVYYGEEGNFYVRVPLLYAAKRDEMSLRRGTVRDVMETQQGDIGPPAQQRLLARLSGWELEDIKTLSLYDWNAIMAARRNFTSQTSAGVFAKD